MPVVREWLVESARIKNGIAAAPAASSIYVGLLSTGLSPTAAWTASNAASGEVPATNGYTRQLLGRAFTPSVGGAFTCNGHELTNGTAVRVFSTGTLFTATGAATNTTLYVRDATTNTFNLATSSGGAAISVTDAGSGTHILRIDPVFDTGSDNRAEIQYDLNSFSASGGDISYQGWFVMAYTTGTRGDSSGAILRYYEYFSGSRTIVSGTSQPIRINFYESNQNTAAGLT